MSSVTIFPPITVGAGAGAISWSPILKGLSGCKCKRCCHDGRLGPPGPRGPPGVPGPSPTIATTTIPVGSATCPAGGAAVTVTSAQGPTTFNVCNGVSAPDLSCCGGQLPTVCTEMWVTYPGDEEIPSYVTLYLNNAGPSLCPPTGLGTCDYVAWCSDLRDTITPGVHYGSWLVNSFDPLLSTILAQYVPSLNVSGTNMNEINYILNRAQYYIDTLGYTFGDVQTALWMIMFGPGSQDPTAPFDPAHVAAILADADANGKCYKPFLPTDYYGIFVIPLGIWPTCTQTIAAQIILLQITVADFPLPCIWEAAGGPCSFIQWGGLFTCLTPPPQNSMAGRARLETKRAGAGGVLDQVDFRAPAGTLGTAAVYKVGTLPVVVYAGDGGRLVADHKGLRAEGKDSYLQLDLGAVGQLGSQPRLALWGADYSLYGSERRGELGTELPVLRADWVPIPSYGRSTADLIRYGAVPYRFISIRATKDQVGLLALAL